MKYDMLKNIVFDEIENNLNELTALSDDLFDHPEVSGKEYRSSEKIVKLLRNYGYDVEYPFAGLDTAFRAVYGKNNHKYKVALRKLAMPAVTASAVRSVFLPVLL